MYKQLIPMELHSEAITEGTTLGGAMDDSGADGGAGDNSGDGGSEGTTYEGSWYEGSSEDVYGDPSLAAFKDGEGNINGTNLLKSYVHAQKNMGKDKVQIPDESASDEDKRAFFQKLGLPEKMEDYKLLKEGEETPFPEFLNKFREAAYNAGVLPEQAKKIVDFYNQFDEEMAEQNETKAAQQMEENLNGLKQTWGDAYDSKIDEAKRAIQTFGNEDFAKFLNETGMGNHPEMIKMFASIGAGMNNDTVKGDAPISSGKFTPDEAQEKINMVMSDLEHPYFNAKHANHDVAVKEMNKLFQVVS